MVPVAAILDNRQTGCAVKLVKRSLKDSIEQLSLIDRLESIRMNVETIQQMHRMQTASTQLELEQQGQADANLEQAIGCVAEAVTQLCNAGDRMGPEQ